MQNIAAIVGPTVGGAILQHGGVGGGVNGSDGGGDDVVGGGHAPQSGDAQWRTVFFLSVGIQVGAAAVWLALASGERQKWG